MSSSHNLSPDCSNMLLLLLLLGMLCSLTQPWQTIVLEDRITRLMGSRFM